MAQFFISTLPVDGDVLRCEQSMRHRERITITGSTAAGAVAVFTGIVQSIEHFPDEVAGRQYRVTIFDNSTM